MRIVKKLHSDENMELSDTSSKFKVVASGVIPFAFVIIMMVYIFGPGADLLDFGVALPEVDN